MTAKTDKVAQDIMDRIAKAAAKAAEMKGKRKKVQKIESNSDLTPFCTSLLMDEPFFGHFIRSMDFVPSEMLPTAGVTVKDGELMMLWNRDFLSSLVNLKVRGLLKHEIFHIIFQHCTSRRLEPHGVANLAADLAINCGIPETELPDGGWVPGVAHVDPETGKKDDSPLGKLVASFPRDMSMEWYFAKIMEDEEAKEQAQGGGGDFDDHDGWDELSPEEKELVKGKLGELLKGAVMAADKNNSWGIISAEMRGKLREMVSNEVDWRAVLRQFVKTSRRGTSTTTWSNLHMSNLHPDFGPGTPGKKRGYTSNINVYIDESGSMSDEDLAILFGELHNFVRRTEFTTYVFDTAVNEKSKMVWKGKRMPTKALDRIQCGGTDFEAPTKHANSGKCKDLDGYIIFTDAGACKPSKSRVKRCYIIVPGNTLPFEPDPEDTVIFMKRPKADEGV